MGEVYDFQQMNTAMEMIKNEVEDENVAALVACLATKDGDMYILDTGEVKMTLEEVSFFAHYFETLRTSMLNSMLNDAEPVE